MPAFDPGLPSLIACSSHGDHGTATGASPIAIRSAPQPIIAKHHRDEPVGRDREHGARLLDAAQVHQGEDATNPSDKATDSGRSDRNADVIASTPAATTPRR